VQFPAAEAEAQAPQQAQARGVRMALAGAEACACMGDPCEDAACGCACHAGPAGDPDPPAVTAGKGDRTNARKVYPPDPPGGEDPWDGERYISRSGDGQPAECTYALVFSTNAVPFEWHGHSEDAVDWEIKGGPARFLLNGQLVARVQRARSVQVMPGNEVGNSVISAKGMKNGQKYTRTTDFRTIMIVAEPVRNVPVIANPDEFYNPAGFCVGDRRRFSIRFSDNVRGKDVSWEVNNATASLEGATTGTGSRKLTAKSAGQGTLTARLANYAGPPPKISFRVYAAATVVNLHFGFVCKNPQKDVYFNDLAQIDAAIAQANRIFTQAGIRFVRASTNTVNVASWHESGGKLPEVKEPMCASLLNKIQHGGGLEIYLVPALPNGVAVQHGRTYSRMGTLIVGGLLSGRLLAHELGHCCGLMDIYAKLDIYANGDKTRLTVTGPVSQERLPSDWSNGPGPEEYYIHGTPQSSVISRLLMNGISDEIGGSGIDIPSGDIYGIGRVSSTSDYQLDWIPVGLGSAGFTRTPNHDL
jgi:hypothetical protein